LTGILLYNKEIAVACVFLATKTTEQHRKLENLIKVVIKKITQKDDFQFLENDRKVLLSSFFLKNQLLKLVLKEIKRWESVILDQEQNLLNSLLWDFEVFLPQTFVLIYSDHLGITTHNLCYNY
jgi:hypothetical protein